MTSGWRLASCAVIAIAAAGLPGGVAYAQEAQSPAVEAGDDIIVTARRREERLQDVPIAVTALSGEALEERSIVDVFDLRKSAPGLNVGSSPRGNASPFVVLRGQRVIDTSIVLDSPVLFYVNEIPWMRMNGINQAFYDIDSVQVLRGPQGTLFGKSTTGGAILINTKKANLDGVEGYARFHLGDDDFVRAEGAVNVPLVADRLAMRIAGVVSRRDGYITSRTIPGQDFNDEHYDGQRFSLHYEGEGLVNDLIVSRFSTHDNGTANPVFALDDRAPSLRLIFSPAQIAQMKADIALNTKEFYKVGNDFNLRYPSAQTTIDVTNITSLELSDSITIKNIFGYRDIDAPIYFDFDGSSVAYQEFYSYSYVNQVSNELQVQGTSEDFDWIVGAFYLHEDGDDGAHQLVRATNVLTESGTFATNESYSAFANGTYRFGTDGLSATAGVRISHDKREGDGYQRRNGACTFVVDPRGPGTADDIRLAQPCLYHSSISFTEPSWQLSLNYKIDPDLLVYVAHRHGYRSGGVQNRATSVASAVPFGAETVNDVEIGGKYSGNIGPDARVMLNVAAYQAWYKDLQRILSFVSTGIIVSGVANASDAVIRGVEVEGSVGVGGFQLLGNVGYTHTEFKNFSQALDPQVQSDLSGAPFSIVPKWTWRLEASYTHELNHPGEELSANISINYVDKVAVSELPVTVGGTLPAYEVVDARIAWTSIAGSSFDFAFSITNLLDKQYANFANSYATSVGWATRYPGPPRRFQGSVTYNF